MKKTLSLLMLLSLPFLALAQTKPQKFKHPKKPEAVSLAFFKALGELDLDRVELLVTEESRPLIAELRTGLETIPEAQRQAYLEKAQSDLKYLEKAVCTQIAEKTMRCYLCCQENGTRIESPLELRKQGKRWYVRMNKEGF